MIDVLNELYLCEIVVRCNAYLVRLPDNKTKKDKRYQGTQQNTCQEYEITAPPVAVAATRSTGP